VPVGGLRYAASSAGLLLLSNLLVLSGLPPQLGVLLPAVVPAVSVRWPGVPLAGGLPLGAYSSCAKLLWRRRLSAVGVTGAFFMPAPLGALPSCRGGQSAVRWVCCSLSEVNALPGASLPLAGAVLLGVTAAALTSAICSQLNCNKDAARHALSMAGQSTALQCLMTSDCRTYA
jgi:hypothetical protein